METGTGARTVLAMMAELSVTAVEAAALAAVAAVVAATAGVTAAESYLWIGIGIRFYLQPCSFPSDAAAGGGRVPGLVVASDSSPLA